jgi:CRISPR type IV-associated protein Csf3
MPRSTFKPLKIIYRMGAPIYNTGFGIHFDSLISYVAVHVAGYYNASHPVGWEPDDADICPLPLARMHYGGRWWYRASVFYPEGVASRLNWARKFDTEHTDFLVLGKARKVTTAGGKWKDSFVPVEAVFVPTVEFWAVGDFRKVVALARRVRHIGKRGTQGYGVVRDMEVVALDTSLAAFTRDWRHEDATPARNLPVEFCTANGLVVRGTKVAPITPPYWRVTEPNVVEVGV